MLGLNFCRTLFTFQSLDIQRFSAISLISIDIIATSALFHTQPDIWQCWISFLVHLHSSEFLDVSIILVLVFFLNVLLKQECFPTRIGKGLCFLGMNFTISSTKVKFSWKQINFFSFYFWICITFRIPRFLDRHQYKAVCQHLPSEYVDLSVLAMSFCPYF